jgi:hypothetical protein
LAEEQEKILGNVFGLSHKLGKIPFITVVKQSTKYDVIPIDLQNPPDKMLIDILSNILNKFLKVSTSTRSRYQGNRINEVGRRIEEGLVHEMNKQPLIVERLGKTGYPDIEITYESNISYMEMKTSSVKEKSGFRYFYYTSGAKIAASARHLLLDISVTQESPGYWRVDKWRLNDLSKLSVRLKNEFNASKNELMNEEAQLLSSEE